MMTYSLEDADLKYLEKWKEGHPCTLTELGAIGAIGAKGL